MTQAQVDADLDRGYDVCLSFASEDREYVERVADLLRDRSISVFYDKYEQARLWGKNLYTHLDQVYRRSARYCVVFVSEHYVRKIWTHHELQSAQNRSLFTAEEYILPARFDDTEVPGLLSSVAFVDLRTTSSAELADLICEKLSQPLPPAESAGIAWAEPIPVPVGSGLESVPTYQALPVVTALPGLDGYSRAVVERLGALATWGASTVYWSHHTDRTFDRLYATSSVAAALLQAGARADGVLVRAASAYLARTDPAAIDDRAATMFRLWSGQLGAGQSVAFVRALARAQAVSQDPRLDGSFLLSQGPAVGGGGPNWTPTSVHAGGAAFHACHVADVLLHIPPGHDLARLAARPVLARIRDFLVRQLQVHDGWLFDLRGGRTQLTLYALALCPSLSIPLPARWRSVAAEALDLALDTPGDTQYLGVMNAWYLFRSTMDRAFREIAVPRVRRRLASLPAASAVAGLNAHECALFLRALSCGLRLLDDRLAVIAAMSLQRALGELTNVDAGEL